MVTKDSLFNRPFSQMSRTTCELQKRRFVTNESYVPRSSQSVAKGGVTHCLGRWHFQVDVPGSNAARAGFVFSDPDSIHRALLITNALSPASWDCRVSFDCYFHSHPKTTRFSEK